MSQCSPLKHLQTKALRELILFGIIDKLAKFFALLGGLVLSALGVMTAYSVVGRYFFSSPILGDTELIQVGMGFCVAAFLPLCQWRVGNIIVDFFTTNATERTKSTLDRLGALSVGIMLFAIGYRAVFGLLSQKSANASTMMMQIPEWMVYSAMTPPLLLTALIGLYMFLTGKNGKAGAKEALL
jgi:TRAP-type C4-dicarboxylate transport system permease small subunit